MFMYFRFFEVVFVCFNRMLMSVFGWFVCF